MTQQSSYQIILKRKESSNKIHSKPLTKGRRQISRNRLLNSVAVQTKTYTLAFVANMVAIQLVLISLIKSGLTMLAVHPFRVPVARLAAPKLL